MLTSLTIKNFSLIEDLEVSFASGLCILTGETGSGKSILLEALSLILGQRADLSTIRPGAKKCIVEAVFDVDSYQLSHVFEQLDVDAETHTVVRRELNMSGKSRAFVNDTPVTLDALKILGASLVDIHTQRQTLQLTDPSFYLNLLDAFAEEPSIVDSYKNHYEKWISLTKELSVLEKQQKLSNDTLDYNTFLLHELDQISLTPNFMEELENEAAVLRNATGLKATLSEIISIGHQEQIGVQDQLQTLRQLFGKIESIGEIYASLYERITSVGIEIADILQEAQQLGESITHNPGRLQEVEDTLSTLHALCQKHHVQDANGLIEKQIALRQLCGAVESLDERITVLKDQVEVAETALQHAALTLRKSRENVCRPLAEALAERSRSLGMEHVQFSIELNKLHAPSPTGMEEVLLLFSANKGIDFAPLGKIASGGELSRIMLVIKSIMSEKSQLPTLILDEIDTGVSGEMAKEMGKRMQQMSRHMQVISITHLPQIAALADAHYKVFKKVIDNTTQTFLTLLDEDARIEELAEMLGGKNIKESAMRHAQELRNV